MQGCNTEAVRTLLGDGELSDVNMLAHLGVIEQRSNELLQVSGCLHPMRVLHGGTDCGMAAGCQLAGGKPMARETVCLPRTELPCTLTVLAAPAFAPHRSLCMRQAFALSKPDRPELVELLRAQPVLPVSSHRVVVEPPSTLEPLLVPPGGGGPLSVAGASAAVAEGQLGGVGFAGMGGAAAEDAAGAAAEEPLPDDVPLTRAQLQAKVRIVFAKGGVADPRHVPHEASCWGLTGCGAAPALQVVKNLDSILERNLKVKHAGAGAGARRR